jgi:hypothetical protein
MAKKIEAICKTTLSWDEKYPASYVFNPSKVFEKWKKQQ